MKLNFGDGVVRKGDPGITPENADTFRQVVAWWLYGPNPVRTANTLCLRFTVLPVSYTHLPVHTKFGVSGQVWIESSDLERLKIYAFSSRRLKRQAVASEPDRDCLFLTRFGGRYGTEGSDLSRSMNVELGRLRNEGVAQGIKAFRNFRFHQSRCTFATELARVAIRHGSVGIAIRLVKQALLHRNEASTLKYIQFVERTAAMADAADAFTQSFLGLVIQPESV